MLSQTGFGRGTNETPLGKVTIDIKAVNGKFLDVVFKAPRSLVFLEERMKKQIQSVAARGTIEVKISLEIERASAPKINTKLAAEYMAAGRELAKDTGANFDLGVRALLSLPDVVSETDEEADDEELWALVEPALQDALNAFLKFKKTEGGAMKADLASQAKEIENELCKVKERVPKMLQENQELMRARIKELLGSVELDENKLANEIAFFVDRVDINEEIKRLSSHLSQFATLLQKNEPVGKQIEFLSQEMTREINTMGSKSNDTEITNHVLKMKNANEKIKEQMRNIE